MSFCSNIKRPFPSDGNPDSCCQFSPKSKDLYTQPDQSVKYIEFANGSKIQAVPTGQDAGRSESLSLLIIDECVSEETKVTVRNKSTGEIREINISDLLGEEYK